MVYPKLVDMSKEAPEKIQRRLLHGDEIHDALKDSKRWQQKAVFSEAPKESQTQIGEGNSAAASNTKSLSRQEIWSKLMRTIGVTPRQLTAVILGGMISRTCTAPFDRTRVLMIANVGQMHQAPIHHSFLFGETTTFKWSHMSMMHAWKEIWKAGGIRSVFAG
jgi:hypothetical protein